MTHQEMTKHIRSRLKMEGIKARVQLYVSCGAKWIKVFPIEHGLSFNAQEAMKVTLIASVNGLTYSRGMVVDYSAERWTESGATVFDFVFQG